ncbi:hypothetical protein FRC17_010329, partial [Serendipita sp. 399]
MPNQATLDHFEHARALFRSVVVKPEPANLYDRQSWNMAGVHLVLTESMLSVYKQAETITKEEEETFAFYALVTMAGVIHHHIEEEKNYLPCLEPEFKSPIEDEHHLFTGPLHELEKYLMDVTGLEPNETATRFIPAKDRSTSKAPYDGKRITATIEQMAQPMLTHLEQEITYLSGDNLRACGLPQSKLETWAEYEKTILKDLDPFLGLVFVVKHTPSNSAWPPLPPGFRNVVVPLVFAWKHRAAWRYVPTQER